MKTFADFGISVNGHTSGQAYTTCPQCSESRRKKHAKCLSVNLDERIFHCMHCDWSGALDDRHSPNHPRPRSYRRPSYDPQPAPETVNRWFARRGIPVDVVAKYRITLGSVWMPQLEEEVQAIQFPYYQGAGDPVNIKYMHYRKNEAGETEKFCREAGKAEAILYCIDDICSTTVSITEGEVDCLSLKVAGFLSSVSVPNGAPQPGATNFARKFEYLLSAESVLKPLKKIILAVDMDTPGQALAEELARRLGPERCWRVEWTSGCKDANEVLIEHGVEEVRRCVESATPWPIKGIISIRQLLPALDAMYEQGVKRGVSTGWLTLDDYYRVQPGELTIVGGIPGHGKTRWLNNLILNLAQQHDWRFAVFSPEANPEEYVRLLIEQYTRLPFYESQRRLAQPVMWEAVDWLNEHVSVLLPEDRMPTVEHMLELARIQVQRMGVNGIIFDPWSWFGKPAQKGQLLTHYAGDQLVNMKSFATRYQVAFWLVAHPTKLKKAVSGQYEGLYAPPTLYDLSDTAHFFNTTDNGVCVWRNTETRSLETLIQIQKIRNEYNGQLGDVTLMYDPSTKRYYDVGTEPGFASYYDTRETERYTPNMNGTAAAQGIA